MVIRGSGFGVDLRRALVYGKVNNSLVYIDFSQLVLVIIGSAMSILPFIFPLDDRRRDNIL